MFVTVVQSTDSFWILFQVPCLFDTFVFLFLFHYTRSTEPVNAHLHVIISLLLLLLLLYKGEVVFSLTSSVQVC